MIPQISNTTVVKFANMTDMTNAYKLREHCICYLLRAAKKAIPILDADILDPNIITEVGARSLAPFPVHL